jgi:hypothetical protein
VARRPSSAHAAERGHHHYCIPCATRLAGTTNGRSLLCSAGGRWRSSARSWTSFSEWPWPAAARPVRTKSNRPAPDVCRATCLLSVCSARALYSEHDGPRGWPPQSTASVGRVSNGGRVLRAPPPPTGGGRLNNSAGPRLATRIHGNSRRICDLSVAPCACRQWNMEMKKFNNSKARPRRALSLRPSVSDKISLQRAAARPRSDSLWLVCVGRVDVVVGGTMTTHERVRERRFVVRRGPLSLSNASTDRRTDGQTDLDVAKEATRAARPVAVPVQRRQVCCLIMALICAAPRAIRCSRGALISAPAVGLWRRNQVVMS